jgi:DNA-binding response OmpR family regulator
MRRGAERKPGGIVETGDLIIDSAKYKVMVEGEEISLTTTEFKLLEYMARRPGVVLSRYQILDAVSGDDTVACDRTVDAHVKSLRRKLGTARDYIETVRGAGYRFREV